MGSIRSVTKVSLVVLGLMLISIVSRGADLDKYVTGADVLKLRKVRRDYANDIAMNVNRHCNVPDRKLILALMKQESDFRLNAVNKRSDDFGILQVNSYHIKSEWEKGKLVSDLEYSIKKGCEIFHWFERTYDKYEAVGRYNGGTGKNVLKWKSVQHYIKRVKRFRRALDR